LRPWVSLFTASKRITGTPLRERPPLLPDDARVEPKSLVFDDDDDDAPPPREPAAYSDIASLPPPRDLGALRPPRLGRSMEELQRGLFENTGYDDGE
tara:strand:+ start:2074 stop:2364 length:291 start_codon:yes stop_codon:yes gene_type:complete